MSFKVTAAGLAAAALLIAPAAASAATEVFTAALPTNGSPFTLNTFDTSLGTLTGITLDLSATATIEIEIFNFSAPNAAFGAASTQTTETVTGLGGPLTVGFTETSLGGVLPIVGENIFPSGSITSSVSSSLASGSFAAFETAGAGTVSYAAQFGPDFTSSITPGVRTVEFVGGDGALQSGTVQVTYDYAAAAGAAPEPAGWALMILGFGGAGAMLRRRRTALA